MSSPNVVRSIFRRVIVCRGEGEEGIVHLGPIRRSRREEEENANAETFIFSLQRGSENVYLQLQNITQSLCNEEGQHKFGTQISLLYHLEREK